MSAKKVVIEDGRSDNLYKVEEINRKHVIYHVRVGLLWDNPRNIGSATTFADALAIVQAHAGCTRVRVGPW